MDAARGRMVLYAVTAGMLGVLLIRLAAPPFFLNRDAAMLLFAGDFLLEGKVPYIDYFEINFPLGHYLSAIPIWIGHNTPLHPILAFDAIILAFTAWSVGAAHHFIEERGAALLTIAVAAFSLGVLALAEFGQREHLFVLLALPYLLLRVRRWQGTADNTPIVLTLLTGVLAGLGTGLKPHFVPIMLAVEVGWFVLKRTPRSFLTPEFAGFAGFGALYAAHFLILPRPALNAYLTEILPALGESYAAYGLRGIPDMLRRQLPFMMIAVLPWVRADGDYRPLLRTFSVFTVVALAIFIVQRKGWPYHQIPMMFGALVILVLEAGDLLRRKVALAVLIALCAVGVAGAQQPTDPIAEVVAAHTQPGDDVIVVDTSVETYNTLIQMQRWQGFRYIPAYPIPIELYLNPDDPNLETFLAHLQADIETRAAPLLLLHAESCLGCPSEFTIAEYLEGQGFTEAVIEPAYDYAGQAGPFDVYIITRADDGR